MKVFACPVDFANPDYANYNCEVETRRETEHQAEVKAWLVEKGYNGRRTGETFNIPYADGYARYMYADGGSKSFVIVLPYGDAWDNPLVRGLTKKAIIDLIEKKKKMDAFWAQREAV